MLGNHPIAESKPWHHVKLTAWVAKACASELGHQQPCRGHIPGIEAFDSHTRRAGMAHDVRGCYWDIFFGAIRPSSKKTPGLVSGLLTCRKNSVDRFLPDVNGRASGSVAWRHCCEAAGGRLPPVRPCRAWRSRGRTSGSSQHPHRLPCLLPPAGRRPGTTGC